MTLGQVDLLLELGCPIELIAVLRAQAVPQPSTIPERPEEVDLVEWAEFVDDEKAAAEDDHECQ